MTNRVVDALNSASPVAMVRSAYQIVDQMQFRPSAAEQIGGAAILLRVMVQEMGVDLSEAMAKAEAYLRDAAALSPTEVKALRAYVREELKK